MAEIGAEMTFSSPRIDQVIVEIFFFWKYMLYNRFIA